MTAVIRFQNGPWKETTIPWTGGWPPPDRIWTPEVPSVTSFKNPGPGALGAIEWVQVSCSQMPDRMEHPNLARGAAYEPVTS